MPAQKQILLVVQDRQTSDLIQRNILIPEGHRVYACNTCKDAEKILKKIKPDLMVLGDDLEDIKYADLAEKLVEIQPTLPIILFTQSKNAILPRDIVRLGLVDWLTAPVNFEAFTQAIRRGLKRSTDWQEWLNLESTRYTGPLLKRVDELETLTRVSRSVTAQLDLDKVLSSVVEAALELTQAEEGSILLLDGDGGELYARAALNLENDFVKTFRLPVSDSLAGQVIQSGDPVFIGSSKSPKKIQTQYLVHSLIYVPLMYKSKTIGVLGVDNRDKNKSFDERHVPLLSTLADFASIAIENAQLYSETALEKNKLENILTQVRDGVLVVDNNHRLVLANHAVRKYLDLGEDELAGKSIFEVIKDQEILEALTGKAQDPDRIELERDETQIYKVAITKIPEIGTVATLHDISYLKELDRLKTDFINTVSHDIRSPLTSILGYVDLMARVGDVNDQQSQFIKRVQMSVHSITELISDLLDMSRIEVGVLTDFELVQLANLITESVEGIQNQAEEREQTLKVSIAKNLPGINGSPTQLRQLMQNLLNNAIKYAPVGGKINLSVDQEGGQVILRVKDNGPGIPQADQKKIFDKFYRSKNVVNDYPGTGLGLAITKSIVDNHEGRIWVDSTVGEGSTFTVVLPVAAV